jgi:hypothetical protein
MTELLVEIAGFLNIIALGHRPPNLSDQARELLEKVGAAIVSAEGSR